jgi:hypothetical protein
MSVRENTEYPDGDGRRTEAGPRAAGHLHGTGLIVGGSFYLAALIVVALTIRAPVADERRTAGEAPWGRRQGTQDGDEPPQPRGGGANPRR